MSKISTAPIMVTNGIITVIFCICFIKYTQQGQQFDSLIHAKKKRVIITGATSGVGLETARELAKRKAHVYMACRNMKKCEQLAKDLIPEAKNRHVYCMECDLSSMKSIREFVKRYKEKEDKLDILINNAAEMRRPRFLTEDGIELQLGVNHFGHFLLTNLLLDLIKNSAPSRIINVSCSSHHHGKINTNDLNSEKKYNATDAYSQSKLANVLFTTNLAKRLTGTGVTVNSVDPGKVSMRTTHLNIFETISQWIRWPVLKYPSSGAETTLYAALDPSLTQLSGHYFDNCADGEMSQEAKNEQISDWLWKVSEKWTGFTANTNETK